MQVFSPTTCFGALRNFVQSGNSAKRELKFWIYKIINFNTPCSIKNSWFLSLIKIAHKNENWGLFGLPRVENWFSEPNFR